MNNNVITFAPAARPEAPPELGQSRDQVLAELLAMNEEMIVQLRLERTSVLGTANFLNRMIEQHLTTAVLLRRQLAALRVDPACQEAGIF